MKCCGFFFLSFTALHSETEHFTFPKTFILVSTLMTWAKTKPANPVSAVPIKYTGFYTHLLKSNRYFLMTLKHWFNIHLQVLGLLQLNVI